MEASYVVTGMTCGHCVSAVKSEVSAIPGVTATEVSLDGRLVIHSDASIDFDLIVKAVAEADPSYCVAQLPE